MVYFLTFGQKVCTLGGGIDAVKRIFKVSNLQTKAFPERSGIL